MLVILPERLYGVKICSKAITYKILFAYESPFSHQILIVV